MRWKSSRGKMQRRSHRSMIRIAISLSLTFFAAGCVATNSGSTSSITLIPGDPSAPSQVTPSEALSIAETYARHPWRPFASNILHDKDPRGVHVDTPDAGYQPPSGRTGWWVPGEINRGIPYKWGGFDDPASFDQRVACGFAAGDVSSPEKRRADNAAVSSRATGVDCSGYVSRCLKLPYVRDSSQLPSVCDPIGDPRDLQPGDLLNIPRRHVMLCAGWARPDRSWIYYYETGGIPEWKPALKQAPLDKLLALGFKPMRYRGMAREPQPTGKEVLTRAAKDRAVVIADPQIGDP